MFKQVNNLLVLISINNNLSRISSSNRWIKFNKCNKFTKWISNKNSKGGKTLIWMV